MNKKENQIIFFMHVYSRRPKGLIIYSQSRGHIQVLWLYSLEKCLPGPASKASPGRQGQSIRLIEPVVHTRLFRLKRSLRNAKKPPVYL
jgi:hypothetical protein